MQTSLFGFLFNRVLIDLHRRFPAENRQSRRSVRLESCSSFIKILPMYQNFASISFVRTLPSAFPGGGRGTTKWGMRRFNKISFFERSEKSFPVCLFEKLYPKLQIGRIPKHIGSHLVLSMRYFTCGYLLVDFR